MSSRLKRPETAAEAAEFERTKTHYLRAGLCHGCAAQASYGHQHGWSSVKPPCDTCRPVVTSFSGNTATGWRYLTKAERRGRSEVVAEGGVPETRANAQDHLSGQPCRGLGVAA